MSHSPFLVRFDKFGDERSGFLSYTQNRDLPFNIERVYWVYLVPNNNIRGLHAHKNAEQIVVALHGEVMVTLENKHGEVYSFNLNAQNIGLYVPNMHWISVKYSNDSVLLSLTSQKFDQNDYIKDYGVFQLENIL